MKTIALFGGTGGLGAKLIPLLTPKYNVIALGSNDVDVTQYTEVESFFNNNEVDIVINLSGYNYDSFLHKYNIDTFGEINKQIDINIKGTINIVKSVLPKMRDNYFGRIILLSSILAIHPVVSTSIYSGCKGFIDSFTKTIAMEGVSRNITCNSLQLGYFDGGLTYKIPESIRGDIKNNIPAKRWGEIGELYNTIEYIINTPYLTGQNINISGGII
jgi:NAD(P)-dependent dehydrogenase (short-subunit alcohol dehydrogenase family)